jgi:hypothetical protein
LQAAEHLQPVIFIYLFFLTWTTLKRPPDVMHFAWNQIAATAPQNVASVFNEVKAARFRALLILHGVLDFWPDQLVTDGISKWQSAAISTASS